MFERVHQGSPTAEVLVLVLAFRRLQKLRSACIFTDYDVSVVQMSAQTAVD